MLSAPGLRFHRALAPFLLRVVGSAHPNVGGVLGYTLFYCGFLVILCSFLFLLFLLGCACPCLPSVPRVGPQQVVTQDVTSDPVPFFGFRLLVMARTCLLHACGSRHSCDVSSDRHSGSGPVFLALGYWTHFPG